MALHNDRAEALIQGVAEDLSRVTPPLSEAFLSENDVTADECIDISEIVGNILQGYLRLSDSGQVKTYILGMLSEEKAENLRPFLDTPRVRELMEERLRSVQEETGE